MNKSMALFAMSGFAAATFFAATPASADWSVDTTTGPGFVGKGDVQDAFGWNDHDLQANYTDVTFALNAKSTSTTTWSCFNSNNRKTQDRKHLHPVPDICCRGRCRGDVPAGREHDGPSGIRMDHHVAADLGLDGAPDPPPRP